MPDESTPASAAPAAAAATAPLYERSDTLLSSVLGRDLMTATTRILLFIAAVSVILATIAAIAG
jgi:hypothetical protein